MARRCETLFSHARYMQRLHKIEISKSIVSKYSAYLGYLSISILSEFRSEIGFGSLAFWRGEF